MGAAAGLVRPGSPGALRLPYRGRGGLAPGADLAAAGHVFLFAAGFAACLLCGHSAPSVAVGVAPPVVCPGLVPVLPAALARFLASEEGGRCLALVGDPRVLAAAALRRRRPREPD